MRGRYLISERDGATTQATTRRAKLMKAAAAIISNGSFG
jgi:chorismate mutase